MLDVGIGFGKRLEDNLKLLQNLDKLVAQGFPVLLGASRKRTIELIEGIKSPAGERDAGSIALHLYGLTKGVAMFRVHNVSNHHQALSVWRALEKPSHASDELKG
ncbi:MAG: dihydropteroate synthase [Deinococcales bacterium]